MRWTLAAVVLSATLASADDYDWSPEIGVSFGNERNWLSRSRVDDPDTPEDERWGVPEPDDTIWIAGGRVIDLGGSRAVQCAYLESPGSLTLQGGSLSCDSINGWNGVDASLALGDGTEVNASLTAIGELALGRNCLVAGTAVHVAGSVSLEDAAVLRSPSFLAGDGVELEPSSRVVVSAQSLAGNAGGVLIGAGLAVLGGDILTGPEGLVNDGGVCGLDDATLHDGRFVNNGIMNLGPPTIVLPGEPDPTSNVTVFDNADAGVEFGPNSQAHVRLGASMRMPSGSGLANPPEFVPIRALPASGTITIAGSLTITLGASIEPESLQIGDRFRIINAPVVYPFNSRIEGRFEAVSGVALTSYGRPDLFIVLRYGKNFVDAVIHETPVIGDAVAGPPSTRVHLGETPPTSPNLTIIIPGSYGQAGPEPYALEAAYRLAAPDRLVATLLWNGDVHGDCGDLLGSTTCPNRTIAEDVGRGLVLWLDEMGAGQLLQQVHLLSVSSGCVAHLGIEEELYQTDSLANVYVHSTYIDPYIWPERLANFGADADFAESYFQQCGYIGGVGWILYGQTLPSAFNVNWSDRIRESGHCTFAPIGLGAHIRMVNIYIGSIINPGGNDPLCNFGFSRSPAFADPLPTHSDYPRGCEKNTTDSIVCAYTCPGPPSAAVTAVSPTGDPIVIGIENQNPGYGINLMVFDNDTIYNDVQLDFALGEPANGLLRVLSGGQRIGSVDLTTMIDAGGQSMSIRFALDVPVDSATSAVEIELVPEAGESVIVIGFDLSISNNPEQAIDDFSCNAADLAEPFGLLDLADVVAFVTAFSAMDDAADLDGNMLWDLADVTAFIGAFTAGCP